MSRSDIEQAADIMDHANSVVPPIANPTLSRDDWDTVHSAVIGQTKRFEVECWEDLTKIIRAVSFARTGKRV